MPHIHTELGQHDTTASAFIIRFDRAEPELLLHKHKLLGMLLQPGGHVELSENPWQAVLHEVTEETGYALEQLQVLQPKERLLSLSGAALHPTAIADGAPAHNPADGESTDLRWLTAEQLSALPESEILRNVREMGLFVLSICAQKWKRVPISAFPLVPSSL